MLWEFGYTHAAINHSVHPVHGRVHTNGIENFWSLLKRGLHGTYVSVDSKHLFRYLDDLTDSQWFQKVFAAVAGKRLTYAELTGATS